MKDGMGRAVLRGTVASVAGILAMDLFHAMVKRLEERSSRQEHDQVDGEGDEHRADQATSRSGDERGDDAPQESGNGHPHPLDDISVVGHPRKEGEPSTVTVGRILYERVRRTEPSRERAARLGTLVHWGYGMAVGGIYGLLEPHMEDRELTAGLGYGAALWLLGDEVAVPMLGLAAGPTAHPPKVHAQALGAHLVYGIATSAASRALRHVM